MFVNLENTPDDPKYLQHYYVDFLELIVLTQDKYGIEKDNIKTKLGCDDKEIFDYYEHIKFRMGNYSDSYPFVFDGQDSIRLSDDLSDPQKLYIFLLLCSCSSYIENNILLRQDFEYVCNEAFKQYLPENAMCFIFGKSGLDNERYKGKLVEKLTLLAKDMKIKTRFKPEKFAVQDSGDGGLDLVAWVPFNGDELFKYIQLYFCQCATGRNWVSKQAEPDKVNNYLDIVDGYSKAIFIPFDGRSCDNTHYEENVITVPIFYDRLRIIKLLGDCAIITKIKSHESLVIPAIEYFEDIV